VSDLPWEVEVEAVAAWRQKGDAILTHEFRAGPLLLPKCLANFPF
jgi:hypothetical protein